MPTGNRLKGFLETKMKQERLLGNEVVVLEISGEKVIID
jgi:hypothetical protein